MAGEEKTPSDFKVVDRRPFSSDGSRKDEGPAPEARPQAEAEQPSADVHEIPEDEGPDYADVSQGFEMLVSYLSTTAMFQLGLIPGPSGHPIPPDAQNAKRTIDMMEVLQEKTKGNLSADETRLLDDVLYELRMTFVEVQKRQAQKTK